MALKRSSPSPIPSGVRVNERGSEVLQAAHCVTEVHHAKRQRAHTGPVLSGQPSSEILRFPALEFSAQLDSFGPCFPPVFPSELCPTYQQSPEVFTMTQDVPRVASSAHINELVAKYSSAYPTYQNQDMWFHRPGFLPGFSNPLNMYSFQGPPDLLEARLSDVTTQDFQVSLGTPLSDLPQHANSEAGAAEQPAEGEIQSPKIGDTFFQDLALMAANADIPQTEEDDGLVEGLALQEDTRHTVEEWLRDSPEGHADGLTPAPLEGDLPEEGERSLPQWVLEELGEGSEEVQGEQPAQSLVRADSTGSSTNLPSFSLKGGAWEADGDGDASGRSRVENKTEEEAQDDVQRRLTFEDEELSVHSSPGEQDLLDDSAGSRMDVDDAMVTQMSRSFSTTWMKDLLEDRDTFEGDLGMAGPLPCSKEIATELASTPVWPEDGLLGL